MPITRAELQGEIYELLNKTPTAFGLLTPNKVNKVIADSLNYVAAHMLKIGGGWLQQFVYLSTVAGSPYIPLPTGLAIVNSIKCLNSDGTDYSPMTFDDMSINVTPTQTIALTDTTSSVVSRYCFSSGQLYVWPLPTLSTTNAIMVDGVFYPAKLISDGSHISGDMDNETFLNYIKWRSASILFSLGNNNAQTPPPWRQTEMEWKEMCIAIIARRFREPTFSRSFEY